MHNTQQVIKKQSDTLTVPMRINAK